MPNDLWSRYWSPMGMKLYDGARSPNARKVRLLAAELELPVERVQLNFAKGEYKTPDYLAKNPNGKIPTLDDDGFTVWESGAILRYLASKRPDKRLVPHDARGQAILDQWLLWWTAHPEAALLSLVYERLVKPFLKGTPDSAVCAASEANIRRFLPVLDEQLARNEYVIGHLSIVDFAIAPWLEVAGPLGVDIAGYTNITKWLARMSERPYWRDT